MTELLNGLSIICLLLGSCCNIIAGVGIFHFPDVYTRMHATGVTDTLGTGLILFGLMLQSNWDSTFGKLVLILIFTLITSPTISYILANTAMREDLNSKTDESLAKKAQGGTNTSNH